MKNQITNEIINVSRETFIISKCVILVQITENHEKTNEN